MTITMDEFAGYSRIAKLTKGMLARRLESIGSPMTGKRCAQ